MVLDTAESLAPLLPGTAVLLEDDWDNNTKKKAYILRKVGDADSNEYEVAFHHFFCLSVEMTVTERFVSDGGDVLPRSEWKVGHPKFAEYV